jgi:uncharacterized membrane protein YfcA
MQTEIILAIISFLTSAVAGVLGLGGGMLLIAAMPIFLPANLVIPLHGITQLSSNASRAYFARASIQWNLLGSFVLGSVIGVGVFGLVLFNIPTEWIPFFIGIYILLSLWSAWFKRLLSRFESLFIIGVLQSGLGLLVGATGPLSLTFLAKKLNGKEKIVATSAVFMLVSHLFKLALFGLFGFAFQQHLFLIILLVVGAILGSWCGTKLRLKVADEHYVLWLNLLLSGLALNMIIGVLRAF